MLQIILKFLFLQHLLYSQVQEKIQILQDEKLAEEFLTNLETKDTDPKIVLNELFLKYDIKEGKLIHRRQFQKILAEFEFKEPFNKCRQYQFSVNNQISEIIKDLNHKNIGVLMNDLDIFMGLIKQTYIKIDKIKKIILEKYFHKFLFNLSHQALKERKKFIARETLQDLDETFFQEPFTLDL